uniref:Uncharacterized protein n=2 Tax=Cacopsylla melanoneura TaxID=428564 RepID=A0A8D9EIB3_9HEMI
MYTIMNQDQNPQPPQQQQQQPPVNAYGNIEHSQNIVTDTPGALQPLHNYTTYELVSQEPVYLGHETTNIIVSAMQVPGQDDLVFFHDNSGVSDMNTYQIEIQDPTPAVEYYQEQHVMSYETLPMQQQHSPQQQQQHVMQQEQQIVLSQQQAQMITTQQQQQLVEQQQQQQQTNKNKIQFFRIKLKPKSTRCFKNVWGSKN